MTPCSWHIPDAEKLGYLAWHDRSIESDRLGEHQRRCKGCGRLYWGWEETSVGTEPEGASE